MIIEFFGMIALLIVFVAFLVSYLASALFLWLAAKCTRIPQFTFLRALAATLVLSLIAIGVQWTIMQMVPDVPGWPWLGWVGGIGVNVIVTAFVLGALLRTSFWRALGTWLPTVVMSIAAFALIQLVLVPCAVKAYIIPTQAMAPTLLGPHQLGLCPHCRQAATVYFNPALDRAESVRLGICGSCQQAGIATFLDEKSHEPDRIIVNKLLTPRRWDLVSYGTLEDPTVRHVKRVVGLPGEEVVIKEGSIWINGAKQEPPPEIAKLTFTSAPDGVREAGWGSPERPLRLGSDEYFVIGDFSLQSVDSRCWGALPGKNIEGVVSVVYYPFARARLIR